MTPSLTHKRHEEDATRTIDQGKEKEKHKKCTTTLRPVNICSLSPEEDH